MAESSSSGLGLPAPPAVVPVCERESTSQGEGRRKTQGQTEGCTFTAWSQEAGVYAGKVLCFQSHQAIRIPEVLKGLWRCLPIGGPSDLLNRLLQEACWSPERRDGKEGLEDLARKVWGWCLGVDTTGGTSRPYGSVPQRESRTWDVLMKSFERPTVTECSVIPFFTSGIEWQAGNRM